MVESNFQSRLKSEIKERFPGCYIFKTDPTGMQGIPDLCILYKDKWAMLEVKAHKRAKHRPNQDYRVNELNEMGFASFIFPENKEEVLDAMARSFKAKGQTRAL